MSKTAKYYEDYSIRKYGAHGTSHMYVAQEAEKVLGKPLEDLKLITAHIGNGASITAIEAGKSV
ncbi:acetate kinase, partial [Shigella flexneri]|nr:acetate kinase [Shigella flexneri]